MTIPFPDDLPSPPDYCSMRCCILGRCRAAASKVTTLPGPVEAAGIHPGRAGSCQDPGVEAVAATGRLGKEVVVQAMNHMAVVLGRYKARWEGVVEREDSTHSEKNLVP